MLWCFRYWEWGASDEPMDIQYAWRRPYEQGGDLMPELFTHCLFAMAVESLVSLTLGLDGLDQWTFIAGMLAMSLNMDIQHLPGCTRGPFSHSLAAVLVFLSFIGIVAYAVTPLWIELVVASSVALLSHLLLDSFTDDGIYLWPRIDAGLMKNIFYPSVNT